MNDDVRLKRLKYRSIHRGCKETDLVFGQFAESGLSALPPAQLDAYERLLDEDDANIWDWLTEKSSPDNVQYQQLIKLLRGYGIPTG